MILDIYEKCEILQDTAKIKAPQVERELHSKHGVQFTIEVNTMFGDDEYEGVIVNFLQIRIIIKSEKYEKFAYVQTYTDHYLKNNSIIKLLSSLNLRIQDMIIQFNDGCESHTKKE
jgi:hypothetical protein